MDPRINLVFWIANRRGKSIGYKKACQISKNFSIAELNRLIRLK